MTPADKLALDMIRTDVRILDARISHSEAIREPLKAILTECEETIESLKRQRKDLIETAENIVK